MWLSAFQKAKPLSASFSLPILYITCLIQSWEWLIFLIQTHVHTMSCLPSNGPSQKLICRVMTVFCCRCPVPICRGQSLSQDLYCSVCFKSFASESKWSMFFSLSPSLANFVSIIYCGKAMPNKQSLHFVLRLIFILNCYRSELEPVCRNLHTSYSPPYLWCLPNMWRCVFNGFYETAWRHLWWG